MNKESTRTENFQRNNDLEKILTEINNYMLFSEKEIMKEKIERLPIIFIVGCLRSGTTLLTQWLANQKQFAYPSNFLSRFYNSPILASKIQLMLTDKKYNYRNEILDFNSDISYYSENGKTKGALAPNEFWYFWRRFIPFADIDYLPHDELLEKVDIENFQKELYGIAHTFRKPFVLKAMICNYNIPFLNTVFDNSIFLYTYRDTNKNIESVLDARKRQLGSINKWYSFKIPEFNELKKIKDPVKQIKGQIYYTNIAIHKGLQTVPEERKMYIKYEKFCHNPELYYNELLKKLNKQNCFLNKLYCGPTRFEPTR